mmetsp:Transcript_4991/g.11047  ORF Transcript_4991/g.11047 Transcript_4991/m.11047 type:complete len:180 (+) Transcript_4991:154-693(+)
MQTILIAFLFILPLFELSTAVDIRMDDHVLHANRHRRDQATYDKAEQTEALNQHKQLWSSYTGADKNYDFTFERIQFAPPEWRGPFSVRVRLGEVESAVYSGEFQTSPIDDETLKGLHLLTIDGIFDQIENALERDYEKLVVSYDETAGYPTSVFTDMSRMIADDELTLKVSNVVLREE